MIYHFRDYIRLIQRNPQELTREEYTAIRDLNRKSPVFRAQIEHYNASFNLGSRIERWFAPWREAEAVVQNGVADRIQGVHDRRLGGPRALTQQWLNDRYPHIKTTYVQSLTVDQKQALYAPLKAELLQWLQDSSLSAEEKNTLFHSLETPDPIPLTPQQIAELTPVEQMRRYGYIPFFINEYIAKPLSDSYIFVQVMRMSDAPTDNALQEGSPKWKADRDGNRRTFLLTLLGSANAYPDPALNSIYPHTSYSCPLGLKERLLDQATTNRVSLEHNFGPTTHAEAYVRCTIEPFLTSTALEKSERAQDQTLSEYDDDQDIAVLHHTPSDLLYYAYLQAEKTVLDRSTIKTNIAYRPKLADPDSDAYQEALQAYIASQKAKLDVYLQGSRQYRRQHSRTFQKYLQPSQAEPGKIEKKGNISDFDDTTTPLNEDKLRTAITNDFQNLCALVVSGSYEARNLTDLSESVRSLVDCWEACVSDEDAERVLSVNQSIDVFEELCNVLNFDTEFMESLLLITGGSEDDLLFALKSRKAKKHTFDETKLEELSIAFENFKTELAEKFDFVLAEIHNQGDRNQYAIHFVQKDFIAVLLEGPNFQRLALTQRQYMVICGKIFTGQNPALRQSSIKKILLHAAKNGFVDLLKYVFDISTFEQAETYKKIGENPIGFQDDPGTLLTQAALFGQEKVITYLLTQLSDQQCSIKYQPLHSDKSFSPLGHAVISGSVKSVKSLLEGDKKHVFIPLLQEEFARAIEKSYDCDERPATMLPMIQWILQSQWAPQVFWTDLSQTLLNFSIAKGDRALSEWIIAALDPDFITHDTLFQAIEKKRESVFKKLLASPKGGALAAESLNTSHALLDVAVWSRNVPALSCLLLKFPQAALYRKDEDAKTLLETVIMTRWEDGLSTILTRLDPKVLAKSKNRDGDTALHIAINTYSPPSFIRKLCECTSDWIYELNNKGESVLSLHAKKIESSYRENMTHEEREIFLHLREADRATRAKEERLGQKTHALSLLEPMFIAILSRKKDLWQLLSPCITEEVIKACNPKALHPGQNIFEYALTHGYFYSSDFYRRYGGTEALIDRLDELCKTLNNTELLLQARTPDGDNIYHIGATVLSEFGEEFFLKWAFGKDNTGASLLALNSQGQTPLHLICHQGIGGSLRRTILGSATASHGDDAWKTVNSQGRTVAAQAYDCSDLSDLVPFALVQEHVNEPFYCRWYRACKSAAFTFARVCNILLSLVGSALKSRAQSAWQYYWTEKWDAFGRSHSVVWLKASAYSLWSSIFASQKVQIARMVPYKGQHVLIVVDPDLGYAERSKDLLGKPYTLSSNVENVYSHAISKEIRSAFLNDDPVPIVMHIAMQHACDTPDAFYDNSIGAPQDYKQAIRQDMYTKHSSGNGNTDIPSISTPQDVRRFQTANQIRTLFQLLWIIGVDSFATLSGLMAIGQGTINWGASLAYHAMPSMVLSILHKVWAHSLQSLERVHNRMRPFFSPSFSKKLHYAFEILYVLINLTTIAIYIVSLIISCTIFMVYEEAWHAFLIQITTTYGILPGLICAIGLPILTMGLPIVFLGVVKFVAPWFNRSFNAAKSFCTHWGARLADRANQSVSRSVRSLYRSLYLAADLVALKLPVLYPVFISLLQAKTLWQLTQFAITLLPLLPPSLAFILPLLSYAFVAQSLYSAAFWAYRTWNKKAFQIANQIDQEDPSEFNIPLVSVTPDYAFSGEGFGRAIALDQVDDMLQIRDSKGSAEVQEWRSVYQKWHAENSFAQRLLFSLDKINTRVLSVVTQWLVGSPQATSLSQSDSLDSKITNESDKVSSQPDISQDHDISEVPSAIVENSSGRLYSPLTAPPTTIDFESKIAKTSHPSSPSIQPLEPASIVEDRSVRLYSPLTPLPTTIDFEIGIEKTSQPSSLPSSRLPGEASISVTLESVGESTPTLLLDTDPATEESFSYDPEWKEELSYSESLPSWPSRVLPRKESATVMETLVWGLRNLIYLATVSKVAAQRSALFLKDAYGHSQFHAYCLQELHHSEVCAQNTQEQADGLAHRGFGQPTQNNQVLMLFVKPSEVHSITLALQQEDLAYRERSMPRAGA